MSHLRARISTEISTFRLKPTLQEKMSWRDSDWNWSSEKEMRYEQIQPLGHATSDELSVR